ncbi:MAG: ferredoxin reductase family protein [Acidimicrobiia bacterium]|nr:ferredoxin reductase family protein [Acidimicrobiia bacterium]
MRSTDPQPLRSRVALAWAGVYLVAIVVPLGVVFLGDVRPSRGFWIELGVALGFVGLAMLAAQSVLTARIPQVSLAFGQDTLLQFHRQAGIVAFALVFFHPVLLLLAEPTFWEFLDPRVSWERALALWFVLAALPALIVSALWRQQLRIPYEWWRLGHAVLAATVVVVGLVHIVRVHHYLAEPAQQVLWAIFGTVSLGAIAWVRVLGPLRAARRPYTVRSVRSEAPKVWTLELTVADDAAVAFQAGQFVFLTLGSSPFALDQHPFSVASSARRRDGLELTIKELGDFTATIGEVAEGTEAVIDGPYGGLVLEPGGTGGLVAIAGGIGITPVISMLRTLADDASTQPVLVIYANNRIEDITFADELAALPAQGLPNLRVVHVLADPPPEWSGRRGLVTSEVVAEELAAAAAEARTADTRSWQHVLCGPPPLMEAAESSLLELGVPLDRIHSERFDIGASAATGRRHQLVRRVVVGVGGTAALASLAFAASG